MPTRSKHPFTADDFALASLAAKFLPPIELPEMSGHEFHHPELLRRALSAMTTGQLGDYRFREGDEGDDLTRKYPSGWLTPFEVLAEEAVTRARVLLKAARGQRREEVTKHNAALQGLMERTAERIAAGTKLCRTVFDNRARGNPPSMPMHEVLHYCLPRYAEVNRIEIMRAFFRARTEKRCKGLPVLGITFDDIASHEAKQNAVPNSNYLSAQGPPACIVLPYTRDYPVNEDEFRILAQKLEGFARSNWERIRKALGKQGGRQKSPDVFNEKDSASLREAAERQSATGGAKTPPAAKKSRKARLGT